MDWDRTRWLWLATLVLLVPGVFWMPALLAAVGLTLVNVAIYRLERGSWSAFPVQVRLFYLLVMLPALWPPLQPLVALQAFGTLLAVFVDYCPAARIVSLFPWNRTEQLTLVLVFHTFTRPPVRNVMQR